MILSSALLGILSHHLYFIHGERDGQVSYYAGLLAGAPAVMITSLHFVAGHAVPQAAYITTMSMLSYLAALVASIITYRLWFHSLSSIPGPLAARITKLYYPYAYMRSRGKYYELQRTWFKRYGDAVRTGPNEVMVKDPTLLPVLSKAAKGTWYIMGTNMQSLQLVRDIQTHSIRRRVWDKAMTAKAVEGYLPRVREHASLLLASLGRQGVANITDCVSYYSFDVMGAITYGRSFGMLEKAGKHGSDYFLKMTHASMRVVGLLGHLPWVLVLLEALGMAGKEHMRFLKWCEEMADARLRRGGDGDLFQVLLDAEPMNVGKHHIPLGGDSRLAIVAGSDTTASTLILLLAYLSVLPEVQEKLQRDVNEHDINSQYLEACISESLRLHPPVPSGNPRTSPPEGLTLENGIRIPGGVNIIFPLYSLMRDSKWFDSPDEFIPERWINSPPEKLAVMKEAFHPFWLGRYQCAGKALAMAELKIATAAIVKKFSFRLKDDWTIERALEGCMDTFTTEVGPIWCVFTERE